MESIARIKSIQEYLRENALDAFLVLTKINRQCLSGFTGSAGMLFISTPSYISPLSRGRKRGGEGAALYVDDRYTIRARGESKLAVKSIKTLTMTPSLSPPHEGEAGRGSRRIKVGIEDRISLREFQRLKKDYPGINWKITHDVIENLRAVKEIREIRAIREGARIIDEIFRGIVKAVKPFDKLRAYRGVREMDIALLIERTAKKLGAEALAFDPIVASGANAAAPHHFSSNQKIKKNNFLLLDYGVVVRGYHSDFTRTLFIGKPNKKQEKVYNTVLEAQLRAINGIATPLTSPLMRGERGGSWPHEGPLRPSEGEAREKKEGVIVNRAKDVDSAARKYIAAQGFGNFFTHNTGHGVGLEIHELPNFSPDSEDVLKNNMIVTIEPGIYIEGWGGVRVEDMVLVTERGPRVFSKVPKDMRSMVID